MYFTSKKLYKLFSIISILTIYGCGGGKSATSSDISGVTSSAGSSCQSVCTDQAPNGYSSWLNKYKGDVQCQSQIQNAEAYRQAAIANCAAGSSSGATGNCSYYKQSLALAKSFCP